LVLSTKRLVAAAKFLVAATKILFVVPNFVSVTKPFFSVWDTDIKSDARRNSCFLRQHRTSKDEDFRGFS